jgi:hypothetical protein
LEHGFVAVVTGKFDLDRAFFEQFGGAITRDFIHFVDSSQPMPRLPALWGIEGSAHRQTRCNTTGFSA